MGTMSVSGLDDLIGDLDELARLPDSVTDQMLNAEADVIEAAQRSEASRMWKGPYYTGTTAASIKKGKIKRTGLDKSITVAPQGHNKRGTRNAEVAFVNEFGKRGQPGRPALKTANERKEQEAVAAGEKVYHAYRKPPLREIHCHDHPHGGFCLPRRYEQNRAGLYDRVRRRDRVLFRHSDPARTERHGRDSDHRGGKVNELGRLYRKGALYRPGL